ncbi:MAG TPA: GAP family protein [Thermomicrobiales bacterium]|nr:GAP family protein [Thermomicrobiales bacterium]HRA32007.1 GAP family protein [Thermomicrobiales bacterium]
MGAAIASMLPMAVAVAVSPIQIIAVILILLSPRAKTAGPTFLIGWLVGMIVIGGLALALSDSIGVGRKASGPSTIGALLQLALGALLLLLAVKQWRSYRSKTEEKALPGWMAGISSASPIRAAGMGAALSGVNPKIVVFTIGASVSIAQAGASTAVELVALAIFIILGSITVIVPVTWRLASPDRSSAVLATWHDWLVRNNAVVMAILLLVFGAHLVGNGVTALVS